MKQINFDLGMKWDGPCCHSTSHSEETHYPSFSYDGKEKLSLPDEGTMTIRYRKTHSSMSESEKGKRYSCCIEVREVVSISGEGKKKDSRDSAAENLDKLKKEVEEDDSY